MLPASPELAEHLGVGEHLSRVGRGQFNQPFQKYRLVDPGQREKVALDGRLDDPAKHVVAPPLLVPYEARGARIAAEVER